MKKWKQAIKIGTLGPKGTSSEAAVAHFIQNFKKESEYYSTILLNSFQSVLHELIYGDLSLAIVPHAYSAINLFYINPQISLYRMFTFNTPPYGLAKRSDGIIAQHHCRVVSHLAPAHLLDTLLAQMGVFRYEIAFVNSTIKAAEEVYEQKADLALTNMNAIKKFDLVCCALYGAIQMGWSVFIKGAHSMSDFFPIPQHTNSGDGINSYLFALNDPNQTTILISYIQPDAQLKMHAHTERQMGMALKGSFTMQIDGNEEQLYELKNAYAIPPNTPHSAINRSGKLAIGLDIKRRVQQETFPEKQDYFIYPENERTLRTGINMCFFVSSWCEMMLSRIPKHALMPAHQHSGEQIGIAVQGNYIMQVGDEEEYFHFGKIYYAPDKVVHSAHNPFEATALSLNLFLPHRYNKPRKYQRGS